MIDKKFLIIGNKNSIGYKEVFPLFKENKIWLGYKNMGSAMLFKVTSEYADHLLKYKKKDVGYKISNNNVVARSSAIWLTNLNTSKQHKNLDLRGNYYSPEKYPEYDNYNAINVDKVADIPCDYAGVMGVPITFIDKYNPEQFEILGINSGNKDFSKEAWPTKKYINAIQHNVDGKISKGNSINTSSTIVCNETNGTYYTADNQPNKMKKIFSRILIRNKNPVVN